MLGFRPVALLAPLTPPMEFPVPEPSALDRESNLAESSELPSSQDIEDLLKACSPEEMAQASGADFKDLLKACSPEEAVALRRQRRRIQNRRNAAKCRARKMDKISKVSAGKVAYVHGLDLPNVKKRGATTRSKARDLAFNKKHALPGGWEDWSGAKFGKLLGKHDSDTCELLRGERRRRKSRVYAARSRARQNILLSMA